MPRRDGTGPPRGDRGTGRGGGHGMGRGASPGQGPTSPICPLAFQIATDIKRAVQEIEGVREVEIRTMDYLWASKLQEFLSHV